MSQERLSPKIVPARPRLIPWMTGETIAWYNDGKSHDLYYTCDKDIKTALALSKPGEQVQVLVSGEEILGVIFADKTVFPRGPVPGGSKDNGNKSQTT